MIANCTLEAYNKHIEGHFLWTAHNEINPRWDYIKSWDMMWTNQTEVPEHMQLKYPDFTPYVNNTSDGTVDLIYVQG